MEELIVIKEAKVRGYYEEPIYDHYPSLTYTSDVMHGLHPGDVCYINDDGRMWHTSDKYGVSMFGGTLWLCPTESEEKSIFGQLTEDTAESWYQLMKKRSEIEERLDKLRSEIDYLEMELEYHLDIKNKETSLDCAWTALSKKIPLEYEISCLEYRYFGICLSVQLLANTLKPWEFREKYYA